MISYRGCLVGYVRASRALLVLPRPTMAASLTKDDLILIIVSYIFLSSYLLRSKRCRSRF